MPAPNRSYSRGASSAPPPPASPAAPAPHGSGGGGNRPAWSAMLGPIKCVVWANVGERGIWHSIRVSREVYNEQTREWESYDSFSASQAAAVCQLLTAAIAFTMDAREQEKAQTRGAQEGGQNVGF